MLDPNTSGGWQLSPQLCWETDDPAAFLRRAKSTEGCALFLDEAHEYCGQHDSEMHWTARRGRHWGHRSIFITHRGADLARSVRGQCATLYLFAIAAEDAAIHAREWNRPELGEAPGLDQGAFFLVPRFGDLRRGRVDFAGGRVVMTGTALASEQDSCQKGGAKA